MKKEPPTVQIMEELHHKNARKNTESGNTVGLAIDAMKLISTRK